MYTCFCGQSRLLEKQVISPPCAVVLLRFPLLVVKVLVALLGTGVTVTLTDMEPFSSRTVDLLLSAVAQATTTPEDMRGITPSTQ